MEVILESLVQYKNHHNSLALSKLKSILLFFFFVVIVFLVKSFSSLFAFQFFHVNCNANIYGQDIHRLTLSNNSCSILFFHPDLLIKNLFLFSELSFLSSYSSNHCLIKHKIWRIICESLYPEIRFF